jgi:hypothetical protein
MALDDYPVHLLGWKTGFIPDFLQAIGELAVVTAEIEETLHQIYWKHAGLNQDGGPIVTDNLTPKRLSEDILKFARLDPAKTNIVADLKLLLAEFEALNTARNQCLHWIWEKVETEKPPEGKPPFVFLNHGAAPSYQVKRPAYKAKGIASKPYSQADIQALCNRCHWLSRRLASHAVDESELRILRQDADTGVGTSITGPNRVPVSPLADIFWPAPWLDKPLPPEKRPSNPPAEQK